GVVLAVAFSPDGKRVATAGGVFAVSGEVRVWDAATGAAVAEPVQLPGTALYVGFSADGARLITAEMTFRGNLLRGQPTGVDMTCRVVDVATGKTVGQAVVHPPGDQLA